MTIAVRDVPGSQRGAVVGTFTAFVDLAFGLGPVSLGAVASLLGYRRAFVAAAFVSAGGLALLLEAPRRRKGDAGASRDRDRALSGAD